VSEQRPYVLHHGDALDVLRTLPDASVDSVVCDPPYFLPTTHYSVRSRSFRSLSDLSILEHFFRDVFTAVRRVLRPTGFAYFFCDGQSYPAFYAVGYRHFRALRPLIWDKQVSINGYAWRHQHELILFCESSEAPQVRTGDGDVLRCRAVPINDRLHLAEKPVELLARLIAKTTPPGGLVLDPFAGSGSTGVAALQGGYRFIGIEREAEYVEIARRRLEGACEVAA
jgi:site-specific DNA-methyltransferase (adenine-specific)